MEKRSTEQNLESQINYLLGPSEHILFKYDMSYMHRLYVNEKSGKNARKAKINGERERERFYLPLLKFKLSPHSLFLLRFLHVRNIFHPLITPRRSFLFALSLFLFLSFSTFSHTPQKHPSI